MSVYLRLFWEFFKTGLFAVGGGMATLPFLHDIGVSTGWYSQTDLMNMLAVSESTPGPIGINMATYVGFTVGSSHGGTAGAILGALVATLGEVTPSIVVILIVAAMLKKFREQYGKEPQVEAIHAGLECGILAGKLPGLDCVSIGPDLTEIHTPRERMHIASVQRVWRFVTELVRRSA